MDITIRPPVKASSVESNDYCYICFGTFGTRDVTIVRGRCGHRFDLDCITRWFDTRRLEDRVCVYCQLPTLPLVLCSGHDDETNPYLMNELLAIVQVGTINELEQACADYPTAHTSLYPRAGGEITLLIAAADNGRLDAVRFLVARGADINATASGGADEGKTALMAAAVKGHCEIVQYLLDNDPWVNNTGRKAADPGSWRALLSAAMEKLPTITRFFIGYGPGVTATTSAGRTALMLAAGQGHPEIIRLLLANGADVNATALDGGTALMSAAGHGCLESITVLLEEGALLNATNGNGESALLAAADKGHVEIVRFLINRGARVNVHWKNGSTIVHWAARKRHSDILALALDNGAHVNATDNDRVTVLMEAVRMGYRKAVRLLLKRGALVNPCLSCPGLGGEAALTLAVERGDLEVALLLLAYGAEVDVPYHKDKDPDCCWTNLALASDKGYLVIARLLIAHGADPNAPVRNVNGCDSIIMIAALKGHSGIVRLLLDYGADLGTEACRAKILSAAKTGGHWQVVEELAKHPGRQKQS